jgi:hypothetical protein
MPHYILELKRPKGEFAVYSTIVDNLITTPMSARAMKSWLQENEYSSWLKEGGDSLEELVDKYGESTGRSIHEMQARMEGYLYWHDSGFTYARESDEYFCPPRSMWRRS